MDMLLIGAQIVRLATPGIPQYFYIRKIMDLTIDIWPPVTLRAGIFR